MSLDAGIQTVMHVPDQDNEKLVNCKRRLFFDGKKPAIEKPLWEDVLPQSCVVKTLLSKKHCALS